jgi:hypothetical protein
LHVCWHKKTKNMGIPRFSKISSQNYLWHKLFEFPRFLTYTFFHSSVNFCGRTNCLRSLERYFHRQFYKNKKQEKQQQQHFFCFTWGYWKWNYPKNIFLIFFKFGKVVEDYPSLKTARGRHFLFRKYRFLNTVISEILLVFWTYLVQFFFFLYLHTFSCFCVCLICWMNQNDRFLF